MAPGIAHMACCCSEEISDPDVGFLVCYIEFIEHTGQYSNRTKERRWEEDYYGEPTSDPYNTLLTGNLFDPSEDTDRYLSSASFSTIITRGNNVRHFRRTHWRNDEGVGQGYNPGPGTILKGLWKSAGVGLSYYDGVSKYGKEIAEKSGSYMLISARAYTGDRPPASWLYYVTLQIAPWVKTATVSDTTVYTYGEQRTYTKSYTPATVSIHSHSGITLPGSAPFAAAEAGTLIDSFTDTDGWTGRILLNDIPGFETNGRAMISLTGEISTPLAFVEPLSYEDATDTTLRNIDEWATSPQSQNPYNWYTGRDDTGSSTDATGDKMLEATLLELYRK